MTDADRFHIPPTHYTGDGAVCQFCGPNFLGKCPHIPSMGVKASEMSRDDVKKLLGITSPAPSIDLTPIVAWFRDELSAARTAAADAKCHAAGHRERVVELEARLKAEQERVAEWTHKATALAEQLEHARCDAKDAQQMLMDERKRTQVPRVELTPGSVDAIKEAVRLVTGCEAMVCAPSWAGAPEPWWASSGGHNIAENNARMALLCLLETLQPAATVKS